MPGIPRSQLRHEPDLCRVKTEIGTDLSRAEGLLRAGEIVAVPTETVYGLAANAFDPDAVLKIFLAKQRPAFDPLIVHVHGAEQAWGVADAQPLDAIVRDQAGALMRHFWPGPLTLVLPKGRRVPDLVTSGLDTVALRMPAHPMAQELLRHLEFPLAAPSANPFGYVSPTTARHVKDQLEGKVPYILDGGPCAVGVESTIIGWDAESRGWVLYRPGGTPVEAVEAVIGRVPKARKTVLPVSPGTLESHYAPRKPVLIGAVPELMREHAGKRIGVISLRTDHGATVNHVLSPKGDLGEAARNLFAALRALDAGDVELILAEEFPPEGLGAAINDRLGRAAAKRG
ncbi:MAG: threonylcarbamoyl-AMP synthase [Flavobacteriales bacterium]|nr:threonylcarbamoyl-AMP synthase [Flavobacteriales bacterium]